MLASRAILRIGLSEQIVGAHKRQKAVLRGIMALPGPVFRPVGQSWIEILFSCPSSPQPTR
jgi:hypothetical protein